MPTASPRSLKIFTNWVGRSNSTFLCWRRLWRGIAELPDRLSSAMRAQATLIDERGRLWDAGSRLLRQSLYLEKVEGDIQPALIDNLGFVGLSARSGRIIVRFNPKAVSKAAMGALYYWLSARNSTRICLAYAPSKGEQ